jgi:uncharacterized protein YbjQ (UPF0145 family)
LLNLKKCNYKQNKQNKKSKIKPIHNIVLNIMNKSRKQRIYRKKKNLNVTKKMRGGTQTQTQEKSTNSTETKEETKEESVDPEVEKIKEEVKAENTIQLPSFDLGDSTILKDTGNLIEGATVNALEGTGALLGVDLADPNLAENNKEAITEMTKNAAEVGAIVAEAAGPFIEPVIDKTVEASGKALSKIGETGVKVLLNTAEEIPGVGIIFGTVRSLSNIGEAIVSSVNAGSEVITASSDMINATTKNYERLVEEKNQIAGRTNKSIEEFVKPSILADSKGGSKISTSTRKRQRKLHKTHHVSKQTRKIK